MGVRDYAFVVGAVITCAILFISTIIMLIGLFE